MPLDNQSELFYHVDEHDQVLGSVPRKQAHQDRNIIHRSIFIILQNPQGQLLLQKRSLKKDMSPGKWTVAASGHATFGQSYDEAAERELKEEIGVTTPLTLLKKKLMSTPREQEYSSIYLGSIDYLPTKLDPDEVDEVRWFSPQEIKDLYDQGELTTMGGMVLKDFLQFE